MQIGSLLEINVSWKEELLTAWFLLEGKSFKEAGKSATKRSDSWKEGRKEGRREERKEGENPFLVTVKAMVLNVTKV